MSSPMTYSPGSEPRTPLLLKVGIIILLVMIIPTVSLTAFLSQQNRQLSMSRVQESIGFGRQTLESNIEYKLRQMQAASARISRDPSLRAATNDHWILPPDIPSQLGIQAFQDPVAPIINKPLEDFNVFEDDPELFERALKESVHDVRIRGQGMLLFYLSPVVLAEGPGVLVLQSRIYHEVFDVVKLGLGQDTTIYRTDPEIRQEYMDLGSARSNEISRPDERLAADLVFTTRYDAYGRRIEEQESSVPWWAIFPETQRPPAGSGFFSEDLEGIKHLSLYAPLPIGAAGEYIGHVSIPASLVGDANPSYLWIVVASVIGLIFLMSLLITRFIVRPIVDLLQGVENLRRHLRDQGPMVPILIQSDDEIGELAASFNSLASELKASFDQIRSQREEILNYTATLEQRVQERTQELEQARVRAEIANVHKSRFLVNMNHELRTPLNSIAGITDLLRFGAYERIDEVVQLIENWVQKQKEDLDPHYKPFLDRLQAYAGHLVLTGQGTNAFLSYLSDAEALPPGFDEVKEAIEACLKEEQRATFKAYAAIREAGETLLNIIDEVIHLSRIESGVIELQRSPRRVAELVSYAIVHTENFALNKGKAGRVTLESKVGPEVPPMILVDGQKIKQVLLNFMTNGVKYTQDGSVLLEVNSTRDQITFSVADTGIGISEKDQHLIFTEFGRAFAVRDIEGTGLGLALSKKLVQAHGGNIGFESQEGVGSRFWFSLPLELGVDHRQAEDAEVLL